jgi:myo-inositol 2-dehydrogenase/D-chiro-inositol 1-dehydrogenase
MTRYGAAATETGAPYLFFFAERYAEAFRAELDAFVDSVTSGAPPQAGFEDGRRALILAEAAYRSLSERRLVRVDEIG